MAIADVHGRIVEVNEAWREQLGWDPDDLAGRPYLDYVHPGDRSGFGSEALRLIEPGARSTGAAARWRAADGSWHLLWWTARSADGLVFAIGRDITQDERAHRAFELADQRLAELGANLDQVLFMGRPETAVIEWASPAFERVWGRPVAALLQDGAVWQRDVVEDDLERALHEVRGGEGRERELRYRIVRPDTGELRHMLTRLRPIPGAPGRGERVVGLTEDITEQVEREERLARQSAGHAAVAELCQQALESDDLDGLFDLAVRTTHRLLDAGLTAVLEHVGGERFEARAACAADGVEPPTQVEGDSQAAHTLRAGHAVIMEDAARETRFTPSAYTRENGLDCGVTVLVGRPERPWGVLGALCRAEHSFTVEEIHMVRTVGHVLGQAIERDAARQAMYSAEELMRRAHRLSRLGAYWADTRSGRAVVSPEAHELMGLDPQSAMEGDLESMFAAIHPDDLPAVRDALSQARAGDPVLRLEFRNRDGRWIEARSETTGTDGVVVGTLQDVTDRKRHDEQLEAQAERVRTSERRFRRLVETASDGIWVADVHGRALFVNARAAELAGRPLGELVGLDVRAFVHPDEHPLLDEWFEAHRRGERCKGDLRVVRPDGTIRWVSVSSSPLLDDDGELTGMLAMASDITERRAAEEEAHMARQHFEGAFRDAPIGMGVIRSDGCFLSVNSALCALTGLDQSQLQGLHFDEITPPEYRGEAGARFAELTSGETRVLRVERPVLRAGADPFWALILATATRDSEGTIQSVVVQVEDVTERRREQDRLRSQVEELAWLERIRHALDTDGFVLEAQPIISAETGEQVSEELLIRMRIGERAVPPIAFLPIAERHGLIQAVDAWVADRAAALAAAGRPVQMNVSAVSAGDQRFLDALKAALDRHSPPPGTLVVELTETALADDMAQARHFAASLEGLGVPLALDDFGVGWASLQYLKTLPGLQCLKIDAEFVRDLVSEERSQALVRAIVELARSFGQQTIAEGVEDEPTRELLCRLGVDALQGFLLGRPAPL